MKKSVCLMLLFLTITLRAFASYPEEYPLYLRLLGFSKSELRDLSRGGVVTHAIKNREAGEFGVTAAHVMNVPPYYLRDYYKAIENYLSLRNFRDVGKFSVIPENKDLLSLGFSEAELAAYLRCRNAACELHLSTEEISRIPANSDVRTEAGKKQLSEIIRSILFERLIAYRKAGPGLELREQADHFPELRPYFSAAHNYLIDYPHGKDNRTLEFFYWLRQSPGRQPAVTLHHVFIQPVQSDFILVDTAFYSTRDILSRMSVIHFVNYADRGSPATLVVFQERAATDLTGVPFEAFVRNFYHLSLKRQLISRLKMEGKNIEKRYRGTAYNTFPYGLKTGDQR